MHLRLTTGQAIAIMAATNDLGTVDKTGERTLPLDIARPRRRVRRALDLARFEAHRTLQEMCIAAVDDTGQEPKEGVDLVEVGRGLVTDYEMTDDDVVWLLGVLGDVAPNILVADDTVDALDALELQRAQATVAAAQPEAAN